MTAVFQNVPHGSQNPDTINLLLQIYIQHDSLNRFLWELCISNLICFQTSKNGSLSTPLSSNGFI